MATVAEVLGPGGIAEKLGLKPRPTQIRMAEVLLERLQDGGVVAVEAPTGVGKTLAYLVAALLSERRVIVSTHTKTLQDQLVDKDLRLLERIATELGVDLRRAEPEDRAGPAGPVAYALMKGRSNYLCLDRLARRGRQRAFGFEGTDPYAAIEAWSELTQRGDRAELSELSESDPRWAEVDARSETCSGTRCPRYEECFVVRMRREAQAARLVVVNHHLLLSDLALKARAEMSGVGRGQFEVVPEADALIVDEAHGLESVASEYFGGSVSKRMLERWSKDVAQHLGDAPDAPSDVALQLTQAALAVETVFDELPRAEGRTRVGPEADALEGARRARGAAVEALEAFAERLEGLPSDEPGAASLARRARDMGQSISFVLDAEDSDFVYWSERQGRASTLGASPIEVSSLLRTHLFERFFTVGLCSATLAAGREDLGFFLSSTGAPEDTRAFVLDSPFDYRSQAALYLPKDAVEPSAPEAQTHFVQEARALIELVGGGALLLFTSHRAMRTAYDRLKDQVDRPCFVQGERPKRELLRAFVERAPAVLCATASFWEGVDIPGAALQLVVMDRLPFESPADPLVAARSERLERAGGRPFQELHLPRAILRFKQGFGRLIRSPTDRGVVALMDGRVRRRGYGRRFLDALPPVARFTHRDGLERWWNAK